MILAVTQNNLEMTLLKIFKFFILLSTFIFVTSQFVTGEDIYENFKVYPRIMNSYGKHRFLKAVERRNYLKLDGPKFSSSLDVLTKPVVSQIKVKFLCLTTTVFKL